MAETVVKKLITQLILDDSKHQLKMKDAQGSYVNLKRVAGALGPVVAAVGVAMTATAGAAAVLTKQAVAQGDKFDKLSQRIGISVEKLSAYDLAAKLSGTSLQSMANSVGRLSRNMLDASEGVGEAKGAFDRLKISDTNSEGKLKDSDAVMIEIAERFSQMPDGAEKTALSMELLGRAGKDMIPMFNQGAEGMARMLAEGKELRGWTTAQAKEAAFLNDNMTKLKQASLGVKDTIGKALIPVFQMGLQTIMEFSGGGKDLIEGVLKKFPDVMKEWVIPAFSTLLKASNMVVSGLKLSWHGLQLMMNSEMMLILKGINSLVQSFVKIGGKIPGVGGAIKELGYITQAAFDTANEAVSKNLQNIEEVHIKYSESNDKIAALQDSLIIKYDESQKRMQEAAQETQDKRFEAYQTTNTKLDEEAKKREETVIETENALQDRLNQLNEDKFDYQRIKLEEEYRIKQQNVNDKLLLDQWYDSEWKRIQEAEEQANTARIEATNQRMRQEYEKTHQFRIGLQNIMVDTLIKGGDIEEEITKHTAKSVVSTLSESAQKKMNILGEAAVKVITGHVAEGLSMVGASSMSVWDAIPNVVAYAAQIAAQIAGAKAIAGKVKFAGGGWIGDHPKGGVINQGAGGRDDVFLGSHGNNDFYGMRGESVFIMNADATKRYLPILSAMNMSTGFAGGGLIGRAMSGLGGHSTYTNGMPKDDQIKAAANNITSGLLKHALFGWAAAGDWLQGIPFGASDAFKNVGVMIPGMFAGKAMGNRMAKKAVGFSLGGTISKLLGSTLAKAFSFGDIKDFFGRMLGYIPGADAVGSALVGPGLSMPKIDLGSAIKKISIDRFLGDIKSFTKMALPFFHNGGVLTNSGMAALAPNEVPFAGIGQVGEVLSPVGRTGNTVNINITMQGIDRVNARRVVKEYLIPELNFYMTSRGGSAI